MPYNVPVFYTYSIIYIIMYIMLPGNNEFETDIYQVVPVSDWTWGQYSDYVRSKMDTFNSSLSDHILNDYAPDLVSPSHSLSLIHYTIAFMQTLYTLAFMRTLSCSYPIGH